MCLLSETVEEWLLAPLSPAQDGQSSGGGVPGKTRQTIGGHITCGAFSLSRGIEGHWRGEPPPHPETLDRSGPCQEEGRGVPDGVGGA